MIKQNRARGVGDFVKHYNKAIEAYKKNIELGTVEQSCAEIIRFECFVRDSQVRFDLPKKIGVESSFQKKENFVPHDSYRNTLIGNDLPLDERKEIEAKLCGWLISE